VQHCEVDLSHLDDVERSAVRSALADAGVAFEAVGDQLVVPVEDLDRVQAVLEEAVAFEVTGEARERRAVGLASPWRRLAGYIAEGIVLGGLAAIVLAATSSSTLVAACSVTLIVLNGVVAVAVFGQTLGMMLVGMRVVRPPSRRPPSWATVLVRWLVATGPAFVVALLARAARPGLPGGVWLGISTLDWVWQITVYAPILFDHLNRGLHDRAAHTVVILNNYRGSLDQYI
jgi:uncharacterized RDD family membrane protein YckC